MLSNRRISLPTRSAIEVVVGAAVMVAAIPLGFSPAGILVAVGLGATLLGVGLASNGIGDGRPPVPTAALAAYDQWLGIAMLVAGSALGIAGDVAALAVLIPAGLAQLALFETTRYAPATA